MAATQEELEFLEGRHLDSEKTASLSQHSVKRSSTIKKTKRKTLVRDSKKSQSSDLKPLLSFEEGFALMMETAAKDLTASDVLDDLLKGLSAVDRILETGNKAVEFSERDGITVIVKVLQEIVRDGDIAAECCWIMSNICTRDDLCEKVIEKGGPRAVCGALERHKTVQVQHAGLAAICNMVILEENRALLCDLGILQALVNAIDRCPHSEWVVFTAAQVVQNISGTANLCHLVLQADILRKLGQFVEVMFDHDDLLQSVCWTTSCMAFALDSSNRVAMYEDGAITTVLKALKSSSTHPGVQFTGCSALSNLGRAELLLEKIAAEGGVELLIAAIRSHERHQGIQAIAYRTLVLLCDFDIALTIMRNLELEALCNKSLQMFPSGPVVPEAEEVRRRLVAFGRQQSGFKKCVLL